MQNSGLGVSLATQFFTAASALPGAIFSIVHNLSGVTLASWWGKNQRQKLRTAMPDKIPIEASGVKG
jgi:BASS family bile acid:Na+ symporter